MALSNTDLLGVRTSVKEWSQRKTISDAVIDDFIEIALSAANRALRIPSLEDFSELTIDNNGFAKLPSNFLEVKELQFFSGGKEYVLDRKHISEVDFRSNANGTGSGAPCIFGRYLNQLRVAPWHGGTDSTLNLYYYKALAPLVQDTDTNWFTTYCPEVLLYGALVELSHYTRDAEAVQQWTGKFLEKINELQAVEDRAEWRGSTVGVTLSGSTTGRHRGLGDS
jgi:hypothetical protein